LLGTVNTEESRKFDWSGKTQRKKKFKQDLEQYKEEDIKQALKKGSKLVVCRILNYYSIFRKEKKGKDRLAIVIESET
jgi:tRNA uridine 5-carbamoylmethylation protein Kti12